MRSVDVEQSTTPTRTPVLPVAGLVALGLVYVVWGSTYLAIRIAVRPGSGFPPFSMTASRAATAGLLLLLWCAWNGRSLRMSLWDFAIVAITGQLLWVGGNGLLVWAEQEVESGYSALIIASVPIWVSGMEAVLDRRAPTPLLVISLVIGLGGVAALVGPKLLTAAPGDVAAVAALLGAAATWSAGSLVQGRVRPRVDPMVGAGYLLLSGSMGLGAIAVLTHEPAPAPIPEAWLAWAYLVLVGSLVGFTSFIQALRLLPTNIAMTYGYVNPLIAVLLGALVLNEEITGWSIAGMGLILLGVGGVFRARR